MIKALLISFVVCGIILAGVSRLGIVALARTIARNAYDGISVITDSRLSDEEKEPRVRRAGMGLLLTSVSLFWRIAACLLAAAVPVYVAQWAGLVSARDVFSVMFRLDYLIGISLLVVLVAWVLNRKQGSSLSQVTEHYPLSARIFHMLAFASPAVKKFAAQLDDSAFQAFHGAVTDRPPIFITSLARGGTTAFLNAFADLPSIATHTYRDMPFVTSPYLWNLLRRPAHKAKGRRERAHGDGLEIDLNSPEAFEEVYWKLYWHQKYGDQIALWNPSDGDDNAVCRLQACFRKIPIVRGRSGARYLAKNNAHIARLRFVPIAFPDAQIIVPIRRPAPHAASLLRQHLNFLDQHKRDDFVERYMRDIGHLEFGRLHTPIAFEGFKPDEYDPQTSDYWLAYWISAFREIHAHREFCLLITQDDIRRNPNPSMLALLSRLHLDVPDRDFSIYFRSTPDETDRSVFSSDLLAAADTLYEELACEAIR